MLQTIGHIPPTFWGVPVFGWLSWSLGIWAISCLVTLAGLLWRGQASRIAASLPYMIIVALALGALLPRMEQVNQETGEVLGVAIRGYGMMLLAVVTGITTAVYRARQVHLRGDVLMGLAMYMFVGGIVGARVLFVVQNWDEFRGGNPAEFVLGLLNLAKGGLVVYGSLFGGLLGAGIFLTRQRLPVLPIGDLIAPSMLFGLALGRIGCLLNGCCYGGACDHPWAVTFPQPTAPYAEQVQQGRMHGFLWRMDDQGRVVVAEVAEASAAARAGLREGDIVVAVDGSPLTSPAEASLADSERADRVQARMRAALYLAGRVVELQLARGTSVRWQAAEFPARSFPVHPTQIYSSINAALLGMTLWFLYPLRRWDGQVFALLLILYPVTRFLLEMIRIDEGNFAGTRLTISQNISVVLVLAGVLLLVLGYLRRTRTLWRATGDVASPVAE